MALSDDQIGPIRVEGKFFRIDGRKWYVKGFAYGPFPPNGDGEFLPDRPHLNEDFASMRRFGANAVRLYHPPPRWLLDDALRHGLRVFVDVPWQKHRCFFEDLTAQVDARQRVRATARSLGHHPAVFAIGVANEFPNDVVRFYGRRRLERFVDELIDVVKQESPDCLATFANFPPTEFLNSKRADFYCFNVFLHDPDALARYLERLQHIAGPYPLLLGEHGIDSLRHGEREQAETVADQVQKLFRGGLAGSFVFSYTDEWFTGGHRIEDWAFGVTRADRSLKKSADLLQQVWSRVSNPNATGLPKVSVVVCSYNGASTLQECLHSLMKLNYPDYEVILVDDGSEDNTAQIAEQFPQVVYVRQENRGLSVARNVGAEKALGEVVAYLDADCVADEDWLTYLVHAMVDQEVDAIGGPNIPPLSDGWVAQCVAASPGGPSHVMLDDRRAEHVPGCNMAFRRRDLLALGGFDPQFRQAGDDVDICWRYMDAGMEIGYAPAAVVWHHRRSTVAAYIRQQRGYGRSESMVHFKHPQRFSLFGRSSWKGIIYGDGAVGLPILPPVIYHGRFGSALFQMIYRQSCYSLWACVSSLEWHAGAAFMLLLATLFWPLALVSLLMWIATVAAVFRVAAEAPLSRSAPFWCRPLVYGLYLLQPVIRGWCRHTYLLGRKKLPQPANAADFGPLPVKQVSSTERDLYWQSDDGRGREGLLETLVTEAKQSGWSGSEDGWAEWDLKLVGDRWHDITIRTATEELGGPLRFTRARCSVRHTFFSQVVGVATLLWGGTALASQQGWAMAVALIASSVVVSSMHFSRWRCLHTVVSLVSRAAQKAGLEYACSVRELVPQSTKEATTSVVAQPLARVT